MPKWKRLDMSREGGHPEQGELTALRMVPSNGRATYYASERYDIGMFWRDERSSSRKLWWHSTRGVDSIPRLKKHYDIWWCPVAEFDGGQAL